MHASPARALKIGIIVFVAACAISIPVYRFGNATEASRHAQLSSDIEELESGFRSYRDRNGSYPTTQQGLRLLVDQRALVNPWNHQYIYRSPGIKNPQTYDLFAAGPDGVPDTADDDWGN